MDDTEEVPGSPAIVGREVELARLRDVVDGVVVTSSARLVMAVGEAGVGKTRLLDEVAASMAHTVVRTRADEHDEAAFGLWLAALAQLDLPRPGSDPAVPASEQRWDLVDLLASAVGDGPAVIILDDLHWADDHSLWVLEHALDRCSDRPIALVAASRPAAEARSPRWPALHRRAEVVDVGGLDAEAVGQLAAQLGAPAADAAALRDRTGGNPLFVREQLRSRGTIPTNVETLLAAAIDRLGPQPAAVVTLLALAGPATPIPVLAAALDTELDQVEAALDEARRGDVLREVGGSLRFRHDLLAEAAAQRIPAHDRRRLHQAVASAWSVVGGADAESRRVRHQLLAVPDVDPGEAAADALAAAEGHRAAGRLADAAALLGQARTLLVGRHDVADATVARVAVAEAEACWALDEVDRASEAAEVGLERARRTGDVALEAAAELAELVRHNPFVVDPLRAERLAVLDDQLPDDTPSGALLRVRLRARRSVLLASVPGRADEAATLGEDAVRRARDLGDPDALVGALRDRFFLLPTPADHEARHRAAVEILDLARVHHRPDLALLGHEWASAWAIGRGDLVGAIAALDELDAIAALMPSTYWRYAAAVRRTGLLALFGDLEGTLALTEASRVLGQGVVPETELLGLEVGQRLMTSALYGTDDHATADLLRRVLALTGDVPALFLQAVYAVGDVIVFDDPASARRRLAPWLGRFSVASHGLEGLPVLGMLALTTTRIRWRDATVELRHLLRPYAGWIPVSGGVVCDFSVDHHLAALALLDDDIDEAGRAARSALTLARRMRSPVLEAHALDLLSVTAQRAGDDNAAASAHDAAIAAAEPVGVRLRPSWAIEPGTGPVATTAVSPAPADRVVTLRLAAGRWSLTSPFGPADLADSVGMRQLLTLVRSPGTDVAAVDLAAGGRPQVVVSSDLGPALDARAKREYRQRVAELQQEIDEADAHHDGERATKHRLELEAILDELRAAVGLGGRDRPQGSSTERARVNAARTIRRAIAAIGRAQPHLGAHLEVSVRTGHHCSYAPEPAAALTWVITDGEP